MTKQFCVDFNLPARKGRHFRIPANTLAVCVEALQKKVAGLKKAVEFVEVERPKDLIVAESISYLIPGAVLLAMFDYQRGRYVGRIQCAVQIKARAHSPNPLIDNRLKK